MSVESEPEALRTNEVWLLGKKKQPEIVKKVGSITHLFNCTTNLGVAVKVLYVHIGTLRTGSQFGFLYYYG